MAKFIISNTSSNGVKVCFRNDQGVLVGIPIPAYALNEEVYVDDSFANKFEEALEFWNNILIKGKSKDDKLASINESNEAKRLETSGKEATKSVEQTLSKFNDEDQSDEDAQYFTVSAPKSKKKKK